MNPTNTKYNGIPKLHVDSDAACFLGFFGPIFQNDFQLPKWTTGIRADDRVKPRDQPRTLSNQNRRTDLDM